MIHTHSLSFIKNKEVDALYFAISILSFASGLISIFVPIYLWSSGFTLAQIVLYFLLDALYFIIFSSLLIKRIGRLTDKTLIMIGVPLLVIYYGLLPIVSNFGCYIYLLPTLLAGYRLCFNVGYHTDFSCSSDTDDSELGSEVGAQYMFTSLATFASPLLGGLLIIVSGYNITFWFATVVSAISLIPLMFFKGHNIGIKETTNRNLYRFIFSKDYRNLMLSSIGYALEATVGTVFWPLYIYIIFSSTKIVGGLYSGMALMLALVSFVTGKYASKDHYRKLIRVTVPLISLVWLTRVLYPGEITAVVTMSVKAIIYATLIVAWSGIYYTLSKKAYSCGLMVLSCENVFNLVRVPFLFLVYILAQLLPVNTFFIILFALTVVVTLLMSRITKQELVTRAV